MYCKKCGKELEDNAVFCQFCGQKQNEAIEDDVRKENSDVSDRKLILVGVIVAVVILAVIAFVKLVGKGKEDVVVETALIEESVEEKNAEDRITENVTESEEENEEEVIEDAVKEMENASDLKEDVKPVVKYMKVGDSECWYDEDGDLVKVSNTDYASISIQYATDEEGNKVCGDQMYFEEQPVHMLTASDGVFSTCYNTKRHLIQSIYYEYSDGYLSSFEFVYDEKNRLIGAKREENEKNSEGDYFMDEVSFEYLEGGSKVIAHIQTFYSYKENGYQTSDWLESVFCFNTGKMISYTLEGSGLDWSWEWGYDENGNMVRESENMSGRTSEYKYWYDEKGNEIRSEKSGQDDDWISESQYDENGNIIREERAGNGWKDIAEYQYNESGKQTKCEKNMERWTYDEEGNMTQHTLSDYNNICEYNEEGKLISYAYLYSITGGDVISFDSRYLYDEQGRLSEIAVDGETAVIVSYNETGMPERIDSIMEVDNSNAVQWQLIYDLLPWDEQLLDYYAIDYRNKDIIIEYR